MSKKLVTIFAILTIFTLLGIIMMESRRVQRETQSIDAIVSSEEPIYYYGITCPYCRELEKFLEENKISDKVAIIKKEVYENQQNANELSNVAKYCGINASEVGLPFILADKKCYIGLEEGIKYFQTYLYSQESSSAPQQ